jgi:hypothetical protein
MFLMDAMPHAALKPSNAGKSRDCAAETEHGQKARAGTVPAANGIQSGEGLEPIEEAPGVNPGMSNQKMRLAQWWIGIGTPFRDTGCAGLPRLHWRRMDSVSNHQRQKQ